MTTGRYGILFHRLTLAALLWIGGLLVPLAGAAAPEERVRVLQVDGAITPAMASYIHHGLQDAQRAGESAVVLRMDTPGGLAAAMDDIIKDILASPIPVIVYVAPQGARAASAGVYITYAAHVAAMAPSTNIGSATPVFLNQDGQPEGGDDAMTKKVVNDAVSKIRGLANLRNRNGDWAEQAVREAVNITAQEAVDQRVVDLVAPDLPALLEAVDGRVVSTSTGDVTLQTRGAAIATDGMSLSEQFFQLISDPSVAYILLSLGMLGIFLELASPGTILPGVVGGLFLLLGLYSLGSLDISWAGVLLMAFAFLLFILDIYLPSHGVLTVSGIIAFALGSFMLANSTSNPVLAISRAVIITVILLVGAFFSFIVGAVIRARLRQPQTGREGLVGAVGAVRTKLDPDGYVFVAGELWRARSAGSSLEAGTRVRVIEMDGLKLVVAPATEADIAALDTTPQTVRRMGLWRRLVGG